MADGNELTSQKSLSGTKSAIFDHLNKLKKWREEQFQQFRNMQLTQMQVTQKNVDQILQTRKGVLSPRLSDQHQVKEPNLMLAVDVNENQEKPKDPDLSLNAHFDRCFSDSSQDASSIYLLNEKDTSSSSGDLQEEGFRSLEQLLQKNAGGSVVQDEKGTQVKNLTSGKPKRPFLKRGTGLLRYMPKSASGNETQKPSQNVKRKIILPKTKLKLKPHPKSSYTEPEKNAESSVPFSKQDNPVPVPSKKHVQFDIPCFQSSPIKDKFGTQKSSVSCTLNGIQGNEIEESAPVKSLSPSSTVKNNRVRKGNQNINKCSSNKKSDDIFDGNISIDSDFHSQDKTQKELELKRFELLEDFAQNNSFNSDSSIVQKILDGEIDVPSGFKSSSKTNTNSDLNFNHDKSIKPTFEDNAAKSTVNKYLIDVQEKKQHLQHLISQIEPAISSLQKEISASASPDPASDDDITSLPVDNHPIRSEETDALDVYENNSLDSSSDTIIDDDVNASVIAAVGPDPYYLTNYACSSERSVHGNNKHVNTVFSNENTKSEATSETSLLKTKLKQLETEIMFFKEQNVKLEELQKEREQMIMRLHNDQQEFQNFKEQEKKKLENEMAEGRRQIRREKNTFERYQKMKKEFPTKKERQELNALRQQVEKLQDELKCKNMKWNNDSRLMKSKLTSIENERDSLRRENKRLQEQCEDLLAALKEKLKKDKANATKQKIAQEKAKQKASKAGGDSIDIVTLVQDKVDSDSTLTNCTQNVPNTEWLAAEEAPRDSMDTQSHRRVRFNLIPQFQNSDELNKQLNECEESVVRGTSNDKDSPISVPDVPVENDRLCRGDGDQFYNPYSSLPESVSDFQEIQHGADIERIYLTGEKEILYASGSRKCISADGLVVKYFFYNGDVKEVFPDQRAVYTFINGCTETEYPDGLIVVEFTNGQVERHYPNNTLEVQYPDGTVHIQYADGSEELRALNGTLLIISLDGTETVEYPNGEKEIRTKTFKRREYPNGAVKILYTSGRQETRYACGRIRIKDKDGNLIVDTKTLGSYAGTDSSNSS